MFGRPARGTALMPSMMRVAAVGEADMAGGAADHAHHHRLYHRQGEQCRHRRIDGVAAPAEHLHTCRARQRVIGDHHAAPALRRLLLTAELCARALPPIRLGHAVLPLPTGNSRTPSVEAPILLSQGRYAAQASGNSAAATRPSRDRNVADVSAPSSASNVRCACRQCLRPSTISFSSAAVSETSGCAGPCRRRQQDQPARFQGADNVTRVARSITIASASG